MEKKMRLSLIPYFGGKQFMVNKILKIMPEHKRYLESFGGAGSVLLNKPVRYDIYNDINRNVVTLFNVLRDKEKFEEFKRLLYLTPFSREIHKNYKKDLDTVCFAAGTTRLSNLKGKGNVKKHQKRVESIWINYELQDTKELF